VINSLSLSLPDSAVEILVRLFVIFYQEINMSFEEKDLNLADFHPQMRTFVRYLISLGAKECINNGYEGISFPLHDFTEPSIPTAAGRAALWIAMNYEPSSPDWMRLNTNDDSPKYCLVRGQKEPIGEKGGLCVIEPDLWQGLLRNQNGAADYVCWLPQQPPIPHELVDTLKRLRIITVICFFPLDEQGMEFAIELGDLLADADIDCLVAVPPNWESLLALE
jgi:hypothetical protein